MAHDMDLQSALQKLIPKTSKIIKLQNKNIAPVQTAGDTLQGIYIKSVR